MGRALHCYWQLSTPEYDEEECGTESGPGYPVTVKSRRAVPSDPPVGSPVGSRLRVLSRPDHVYRGQAFLPQTL